MSSYFDLIHSLAQTPALCTLRQCINAETVIANAITIQQIAAPTFYEATRAQMIEERFRQSGLENIHRDDMHNVYGCWKGSDTNRPALLISAHTDTVFTADTDLTIRYEHKRIYGPGLGDNSLGVAGLLALLDLFNAANMQPASTIWFVANSREEGLGDLGGIRAVWSKLGTQLGAAIVLEGMALGRIYHQGIAVRRLHITCKAPGGHSWLHFGQPSAIHGLIELGARITAKQVPRTPRTTYNIGMINGGHSVNSIATTADLYLDLRSESSDTLAELEGKIRDDIAAVQHAPLSFEVELVGDRPSGSIPAQHPLVQMAAAALAEIDYKAIYENGSTDANVLLANKLPTVTVGISHGGQAHRLDEYIDTEPIADGIWHLVLLTLATAEHLHHWSP